WFNFAASAFLALLIVGVSPYIAWFYEEPRVAVIAMVLSSCVVIAGIRNQHSAILKRQLRFGTIAIIDSVSAVCGMATGIGCALGHLGYWSLVAMNVVTAA